MSTKRIAICFSGQARTWEYCVENIKRFFSTIGGGDNKIDYFIHTWDVNSYRGHTTLDRDQLTSFDDSKSLYDAYKPVEFEVENFNTYVDCRKYSFPITAWEPMYHSYKKSINFKRCYELKHDFEYDIVIKARLDCIYDPDAPLTMPHIVPLVAYTSREINKMSLEFFYNDFDEALFFGDSLTMDLLSLTGDLHLKKYTSSAYTTQSTTRSVLRTWLLNLQTYD